MDERVEKRYEQLKKDAAAGGYILNPDAGFMRMLVGGLVKNEDRYGIESCPCRLHIGGNEENIDIICPCVYRDDDLSEYGACFCAMYVASEEMSGQPQKQIPERRPPYAQRKQHAEEPGPVKGDGAKTLPYPVYRCTVCGYLCARNSAPEVCPICKAKKDRFEIFMK